MDGWEYEYMAGMMGNSGSLYTSSYSSDKCHCDKHLVGYDLAISLNSYFEPHKYEFPVFSCLKSLIKPEDENSL